MIKFKMLDKGYCYETEDGKIRLEKRQEYVCVVKTLHGCMDRWAWRFYWNIYGIVEEGHPVVYRRRTLNEAKAFVREYFKEV